MTQEKSNTKFSKNNHLITHGKKYRKEYVTKKVKKTNPETACEKIPKEICAPSGCVVEKSEKVS